MIRPFRLQFCSPICIQWVFTLGLSLSASVDILVTVVLCYNLTYSKTGRRRHVYSNSYVGANPNGLISQHGLCHRFCSTLHIREWILDLVRDIYISGIDDSLIFPGSLSSSAIISLICWLTMPENRVFLAPHFMIGKCKVFSDFPLLIRLLNPHHKYMQTRCWQRTHTVYI